MPSIAYRRARVGGPRRPRAANYDPRVVRKYDRCRPAMALLRGAGFRDARPQRARGSRPDREPGRPGSGPCSPGNREGGGCAFSKFRLDQARVGSAPVRRRSTSAFFPQGRRAQAWRRRHRPAFASARCIGDILGALFVDSQERRADARPPNIRKALPPRCSTTAAWNHNACPRPAAPTTRELRWPWGAGV